MNDHDLGKDDPISVPSQPEEGFLIAMAEEEAPQEVAGIPVRARGPRIRLPLILFALTCLTTFLARSQVLLYQSSHYWWVRIRIEVWDGLVYAGALMTILACHEFGHYLQARRNGVPASLPFFIPMPIGPLGTLGAVIGMSSN
ncbi:MAG: zinc metalloprotease, partial [Planctomycetota bacterium]